LSRVAMDTSVIIEYVDLQGEFHEQAGAVFAALAAGKLEAIVPHAILAETFHVATRLYAKLHVEGPELVASELVEWLYRLPSTVVPNEDLGLAVDTGKAKSRFGLALTDCYVLAASKRFACRPLFRKVEGEMARCIEALKQEYQVLFLEEYT